MTIAAIVSPSSRARLGQGRIKHFAKRTIIAEWLRFTETIGASA
jgi:hypothetical protein